MRSSLSVGDKVIIIGGIVVNVVKVEDDVVILELGLNRIKVLFEKWVIGIVKFKKEEIEED